MVVGMSCRIDIQSCCKLGVALDLEAFIVAFQFLFCVARRGLGGEAADLLLLVLAGTSDEGLCLAGLKFFAWIWCVTFIHTIVFTNCLLASTSLLTRQTGVLALSLAMTFFLAAVDSALQHLTTR